MHLILPAIAERRSIRVWQDRPVETDKIEAMLEAARLAPSSINLQHFRVIVADRPTDLAAVRAAAYQLPAVAHTPVVLVCMADLDADQDVARHDEVRAHFGLPAHVELLTLLPVGYAAEQPAPRPRNASVRWQGAAGG